MKIDFVPLTQDHFPYLLKWLEALHVKEWWDPDISWTLELITKKYESYCEGMKTVDGITGKIAAYLILIEGHPVGYSQVYALNDFPTDMPWKELDVPPNSAGIDWYIGEQEFTGVGLGPKILNAFLEEFVAPFFDHVLVDPAARNTRALHAYEKAGFRPWVFLEDADTLILIKDFILTSNSPSKRSPGP